MITKGPHKVRYQLDTELFDDGRECIILLYEQSLLGCKGIPQCKNSCISEDRFKATTFGRFSKYDSGTSISAKALLLIAIAAFRIWLVHSRLCSKCFLDLPSRPPEGTLGTGNHHFSWRWRDLRKDVEPSDSGAKIPWSAYQNSALLKLSNISCGKVELIRTMLL